MERRNDLGLRGGHGSLDASSTGLGDLTTEPPQGFDITDMHGQLMDGGTLRDGLSKGPTLKRGRAGMNDILSIRTGKSRRKRHVHGQIDGGIDTGRRRHGRSTVRTTEGLRGQIGMRPGHAERRSHPLPAMTGLAGEIGDLVHGQDGKDRITLTP